MITEDLWKSYREIILQKDIDYRLCYNLVNLPQNLQENWNDLSFIQWMEYIFENLFRLSYVFDLRVIIEEYFKIGKRIGGGVYGSVYYVEFQSSLHSQTPEISPHPQLPFVIKNNNRKNDANGTIKEFLIGKQLNLLIEETPIFMKTYGFMDCSPVSGSSFCQKNEETTLVCEFVKGKILSKCELGAEEIEKMIYMMAYGLEKALKYSFSHNDVHGGNVMVRELDSPIAIPIKGRYGIKYIIIDKIPTLIDFGLSNCLVTRERSEGEEGENGESDEVLILSDSFSELDDLFNFIIWILYINADHYDKLKWILAFFDMDISFQDFEKLTKLERIALEGDNQYKSLEDFLIFMNDAPNLEIFFGNSQGYPVYGISNNRNFNFIPREIMNCFQFLIIYYSNEEHAELLKWKIIPIFKNEIQLQLLILNNYQEEINLKSRLARYSTPDMDIKSVSEVANMCMQAKSKLRIFKEVKQILQRERGEEGMSGRRRKRQRNEREEGGEEELKIEVKMIEIENSPSMLIFQEKYQSLISHGFTASGRPIKEAIDYPTFILK